MDVQVPLDNIRHLTQQELRGREWGEMDFQ
jgi:hypothetical protein